MSESKHSPLPWTLSPFGRGVDVVAAEHGKPEHGRRIVAECKATCGADLPRCEADADYIVRACNSFPALLAACEAALPFLSYVATNGSQTVGADETWDRIETALAAAKGGAT